MVNVLSPSLSKEEINNLPIWTYDGPIRVVRYAHELDAALETLADEPLLGFDTESRPSFKRGKSYATSLIQLAGAREVVLVRLKNMTFSPLLINLLENPAILKAGVAIGDDMHGLQRLHRFVPAGHVDLSHMAKGLGLTCFGLRSLAANLLRCRISKGSQCSNWENKELTAAQIRYAATDAWIGRELYLHLCALQQNSGHTG